MQELLTYHTLTYVIQYILTYHILTYVIPCWSCSRRHANLSHTNLCNRRHADLSHTKLCKTLLRANWTCIIHLLILNAKTTNHFFCCSTEFAKTNLNYKSFKNCFKLSFKITVWFIGLSMELYDIILRSYKTCFKIHIFFNMRKTFSTPCFNCLLNYLNYDKTLRGNVYFVL